MTYSGSSPNNSNNSDTTIPPERQQYVDTTGDGEIDTLILGTVVPDDPIEDNSNNRTVSTTTNETQPVEKEVTPPPDKLNAQQVEVFTKLIKTNPVNPKWQ